MVRQLQSEKVRAGLRGKFTTQFLPFCGKRFTCWGAICSAKWLVFRGGMIGTGVALCDGRRSGAAMMAIGRELRPEVLPPPFSHFGAKAFTTKHTKKVSKKIQKPKALRRSQPQGSR